MNAATPYDVWRQRARALLLSGVKPEEATWEADDPGLFAVAPAAPTCRQREITVPRAFVALAGKAVLHADPQRFSVLYRVLWRLQADKALLEDAADPDVVRLEALARAVRREEHRMHAFVRFREVSSEDGPRYIAWYEPRHDVVREAADFFVRRFASMRWSIVTPTLSAHWNGVELAFGPGGVRADAPAEDARDDDWRTYYAAMFNPARLKVAAMTREMPRRYWKNLPEAQIIPELVAAASRRADDMVAAAPTLPAKRAGVAHARIAPAGLAPVLAQVAERAAAPDSLSDLAAALAACRGCALWRPATQVVPGEGPPEAPLLALVGEQPGDQEDLAGRPFVGPAGEVLDRALAQAGIDRRKTYVTNAVKHFKFEPRGKRRLHSRPNGSEIDACRWWVEHELALVRPAIAVALGATALQSLTGYTGALGKMRGQATRTRQGRPVLVTVHPSYLLRLPDPAAREAEFTRFVADLRRALEMAETAAADAAKRLHPPAHAAISPPPQTVPSSIG